MSVQMSLIKTVLALGLAVGCGVQLAFSEDGKERSPLNSSDFFPIMAWDWNYDNWNYFADEPSQRLEQLKMMKECGFTIAGLFRESELNLVQEAGLKALIIDPRITYDWVGWLHGKKLEINEDEARKKVESLVNEVKGRDVVYGYYVVDEPGSEVLPAVGIVTRLLKEADPSRITYVNLHPNYAPPKYIAGNYDEYLQSFIELSQPNMLSVDNYFLMRPDESIDSSLTALFYSNMAKMRDASLAQNVPFWSVLLSMPHQTYVNITRGNMARQVYASLAYGAKGLSYFCYFQNRSPDATSGPIDRAGNKTPIWGIVSELNHEVLALAPTLNRLKVVRNYFLGEVPAGSEKPPGDALVTGFSGAASALLIGEFRHEDGGAFVFVVNTDRKQSASVDLVFNNVSAVQRVSAKDGEMQEVVDGRLLLKAGEGALLKLTLK